VDQFQRVVAVRANRTVARLPVKWHDGLTVPVRTTQRAVFTLHRGESLRTRLRLPDRLEGPLPKGSQVGSLEVLFTGRDVRSVPVVAAAAVPGAGLPAKVWHALGPGLAALALLLIGTGGVLLKLRLRSQVARGRRAATPR
jgi:hypothetical protein